MFATFLAKHCHRPHHITWRCTKVKNVACARFGCGCVSGWRHQNCSCANMTTKEAWVMLQYNIETWFNFRITCIFSGAKVQRWQARLNWNSPLLQHWAQLACSRPYISQVMSQKKLNYYSNALKNVQGLYWLPTRWIWAQWAPNSLNFLQPPSQPHPNRAQTQFLRIARTYAKGCNSYACRSASCSLFYWLIFVLRAICYLTYTVSINYYPF